MAVAEDGVRSLSKRRKATVGDTAPAEALEPTAAACHGAVARARPAKRAAKPAAGHPETQPLPAEIAGEPIEAKSPAQWAYERLILYIRAFEEGLDASEEVAMGFAGGEAGVLRIEGLGYFAPDIITFDGLDENDVRTQLIQHVSQLNVMLRALPKSDEEPRRIGFDLAASLARK